MAFSFSKLFGSKSKPAAKEEPVAESVPMPPPAPKPELPSGPEGFRSPRVAVPNSVRPVSLRTTPAPAPPSFPAPQSAPRTISFPNTGGSSPTADTFMTEPTPPLDPPPAVVQSAPDVNVTLELGDFIDRIPPSFVRPGPVNRQQPVVFHASDLYSDLSRGRASVPLSVIYNVCGEIFAKPVSSTEDVEVLLPLQKLVEQMSSSLKQRGDQIQDEDVGQIDTPFLQVALEDQARLPQAGTIALTPAAVAPAPVAPQKPPTGPIPVAAPSFGQIRPPSGPVPLAATEAPPPPPAAMPSAPAPIMGEAAPAGKRLPSTVRASVSGGKIRLSGPSLPGQRPAVVPAGFGTAPIPARPIVPAQTQAPVTALTSKKTARIQLPPIALRSSASTAASAPPAFNKPGSPPPAPAPAAVRPAPPAPPAARAPISAAPSAFRTPTVPATATPATPASTPVSIPTPPPVPEAPAQAAQQPVRTTIVPAPVMPGTVEPPPVTSAVPTATPAPTSRVPMSRRSEPTPMVAPAPVAPLPPPPRSGASSAGLEAPSRPAGGASTQIQLSLAAILRALPATALGEGMTLVDDSVRIMLPFGLVEPQLAQGRVSIAREQFLAVLPDDFRDRFAANCELATIPIPLQEIFQNLPMNALAMREDQIVPETGPEIPTPFGQKAAEDAQRLQTEPAVEPVAAAAPAAPATPAAPPPLEAPPKPVSEPIPMAGPAATGLTPIAATTAPTPAIPTAPLPVPPKIVAPVMKIERVAPPPPPPVEPPLAPPPLPPMVTPIPVAPVPAVPIARAPEPVAPPVAEPETPVRTTTRIVLGASSAPVTVQPTLKPTQLHDPIATARPPKPETTSVPLLPVTEEEVAEPQPPGMAELQSIFMTDETLDAKKVVRLVSKLPGITACTIMFSDGLTLAGNFPKELDGEGFSAMSPQFYRRAVAFTTELNLGEMQTYSVYTDRVVLSFFMQEDICLSVMQTGRSFLPGVREKLMCVTTELSRMYARAGAH